MSDPLKELDNLLLDLKLTGKDNARASAIASLDAIPITTPSKSSSTSYSSEPTTEYYPVSEPPRSYRVESDSSGGRGLNLTAEEAQLVGEINRLRRNPAEYANILENERKYNFDGKYLKKPGSKIALITEEGVAAVDEAIRVLNNQKSLPEFIPSYGMTLAAREAAQALYGPESRIDSVNRLSKFGEFKEEAVEIASFGQGPFEAKEILQRFLISDGNVLRDHRNYLLSPKYAKIGVAVANIPNSNQIVALVNFSKQFYDRKDT